jgi:hypothetical protein
LLAINLSNICNEPLPGSVLQIPHGKAPPFPFPFTGLDHLDGVQHRVTLQLPRRVPAAAPGRPSSADLARIRPLMCALGDALAAQEEGLDPERLSRTYTALMSELQEVAGMGVHAVELTPATLAPVLPEGEEEDEEDEEDDEKGNAQLAEVPEELRALAGDLRELAGESRVKQPVGGVTCKTTARDAQAPHASVAGRAGGIA